MPRPTSQEFARIILTGPAQTTGIFPGGVARVISKMLRGKKSDAVSDVLSS